MTFNELNDLMNELRSILAERLQYSKNWGQVSLEIKRTFWRIKWFDNNEFHDPKGKILFKEITIAPLSRSFLKEEIKRQKKKLKKDKKDYVDEDMG